VNKSVPFLFQILRPLEGRCVITTTIITITSRGPYSGIDSRESSYSQQKAHKENKLASNGYKFAREESAYSSR
jgi:hypothetical protein